MTDIRLTAEVVSKKSAVQPTKKLTKKTGQIMHCKVNIRESILNKSQVKSN